jgi:hypothetical protein
VAALEELAQGGGVMEVGGFQFTNSLDHLGREKQEEIAVIVKEYLDELMITEAQMESVKLHRVRLVLEIDGVFVEATVSREVE